MTPLHCSTCHWRRQCPTMALFEVTALFQTEAPIEIGGIAVIGG
jgi:hypothetical protein